MQCLIKNLTISLSGIFIYHKETLIKIAINCDKSMIEENLELHSFPIMTTLLLKGSSNPLMNFSTFGTPELKE